MLTQCPNCQTMYQISAGELGAAKGFVECGECAKQFNALDRIADEPQFDANALQPPAIETQQEKPAPTFVLMEEQDSAEIDSKPSDSKPLDESPDRSSDQSPNQLPNQLPDQLPDQPVSLAATQNEFNPATPHHDIANFPEELDELDKTQELSLLSVEAGAQRDAVDTAPTEAVADEHVQKPLELLSGTASASLPPEEHEILFHDPGSDQAGGADENSLNATAAAETHIDLDEVPAILQEELLAMGQTKKSGAQWYWAFLAVVLFAGVLVQTAWHYREPMLARFPSMQSPIESVCAVFGCKVLELQPVEPIQLLTRDVRTHPRYENSLLVNASMINSGAETIDFPTVKLGLFDPTGTAIGIRHFSPPEYLDKSIDIASGIPPGRSVHVILELANTGDRASSFEFSFH